MTPAEVYPHVLSAVRLIMQDKSFTTETPDVEAQVHKALWSYVTHAVDEVLRPSAAVAGAPKQDRRSKAWQCVIRFCRTTPPSGLDLVAETDPETIQGTGALPQLIEQYAAEMHPDDALFPSELVAASIRERIPQMRNNLGRQGRATLGIEYEYDGCTYLCQVDVSAA